MSFKRQTEPTTIVIGQSWRTKLENFVNEKIRIGRDGLDLNHGIKGAQPFLVYRHHEMQPEVFELGCAIADNNPQFDYKVWAHWMLDADLRVTSEAVLIDHRSKFFCQYAEKYLANSIGKHYELPVIFKDNFRINQKVEQ